MKRRLLSVLLLIALILVLASCTDPDPYYVPEQGSGEKGSETAARTSETTAAQEETGEKTPGIITPIIPFPEA